MISRLLSWLFPSLAEKGNFHPHDMRSIMNYYDRQQRARGEDYTRERTQFTIGTKCGRVIEGEYVDVGPHANSRLHFSDDERTLVAVYPVQTPPEPTTEDISDEAMEALTYSPEELELLKVCPAVKEVLSGPMSAATTLYRAQHA